MFLIYWCSCSCFAVSILSFVSSSEIVYDSVQDDGSDSVITETFETDILAHIHSWLKFLFFFSQMGMMGTPGPYGSSYNQCGGQSLGPPLQNKAGQPNSINQFSMDKKPQHGQTMGGMVRELYRNCHRKPHPHTFPDPLWNFHFQLVLILKMLWTVMHCKGNLSPKPPLKILDSLD